MTYNARFLSLKHVSQSTSHYSPWTCHACPRLEKELFKLHRIDFNGHVIHLIFMTEDRLDKFINYAVALMAFGTSLLVGYLGYSMAMGPPATLIAWSMPILFWAVAFYGLFYSWRLLKGPSSTAKRKAVPLPKQTLAEIEVNYPTRWEGEPIPLETQIENLAMAGIELKPECTIDHLLKEFPREAYERDPYDKLLYAFAVELCPRGLHFEMESVGCHSDYVNALQRLIDITGETELVTDLADDFDDKTQTWHITYKIKGQERRLIAKSNRDWVDPDVLSTFLEDIEKSIDNGMSFRLVEFSDLTYFFISDEEADAINMLRPGIIS